MEICFYPIIRIPKLRKAQFGLHALRGFGFTAHLAPLRLHKARAAWLAAVFYQAVAVDIRQLAQGRDCGIRHIPPLHHLYHGRATRRCWGFHAVF